MKRCPHCGRSLMTEPREVSQLGLTPKQFRLLQYIKDYTAKFGTPPNFREMCAEMSVKSKSGIARLLVGLQERGHIHRVKGRHYMLTVIDREHDDRAAA